MGHTKIHLGTIPPHVFLKNYLLVRNNLSKIIKFSQCTPWCPYSTRHSHYATPYDGHCIDSQIACIKHKNGRIVGGHIRRLHKLKFNDNSDCYLKEYINNGGNEYD